MRNVAELNGNKLQLFLDTAQICKRFYFVAKTVILNSNLSSFLIGFQIGVSNFVLIEFGSYCKKQNFSALIRWGFFI
jgi:hypothetical protein